MGGVVLPLHAGTNTPETKKGAHMPTKKTSTTPKKTIEVDPALAGLDIIEAIKWLNRRIAQYDHTNVDWFKIESTPRSAWHRHDPPERTGSITL